MNTASEPTTTHPAADSVVTHLAETVLATAAAVDVLSDRLDQLAQQVQQQDCQLFALGADIQATQVQQQVGLDRLDRLTQILEGMAQNLLSNLPDRDGISSPHNAL
jgi:isocitrate lyase